MVWLHTARFRHYFRADAPVDRRLADVLDNLGVFRAAPHDLVELCQSGFRRVPISTGSDYYLSLQCFAPHQVAYAHTHPDSEEWVTVLGGTGQARFGTEVPLLLSPGMVVGRAERYPHGFLSGHEPMRTLPRTVM